MRLDDGDFSLENCDQEPIHIPGSIQPHGVLFGLGEPALRIEVASENTSAVLGLEVHEVLGAEVSTVLDEVSVQRIRSALSLADPSSRSPLELCSQRHQVFDGVLHRSGGLALLELEPIAKVPRHVLALPQLLSRAAAELRSAAGIEEIAQLTATRVRELTGYDRCMVYRFDAQGNGAVIGEAREPRLPAYLGLHYPAADIPPQARRLYRENTLRLIVDVDYAPSLLEPRHNPCTGAPLDLGRAVLRSVSPFHREYLRNMGVRATLAVSILVDGDLWGLLVCHHYEPRHIRHELRATCEVLGLFLAQRIAELGRQEAAARIHAMRELTHELGSKGASLSSDDPRVVRVLTDACEVLRCSALLVCLTSGVIAAGKAPSDGALASVLAHLETMDVGAHFATDRLVGLGAPAVELSRDFAGMLAVRMTHEGEWIVALRQELVKEVTWGSSKEKKVTIEHGFPRLSPEGSFGLWKEVVQGHSREWSTTDLRILDELQASARTHEASRLADLTARTRELQRVAEAKDEFLAQLSHELRNPLNAVMGWADLLLSDAGKLEGQSKRGLEVIQRNARVQARLIDDLLDVSRIVRGSLRLELTPQIVEPILRAALESIESAASARSIHVQTTMDPATAPVNADPIRLQQVIWNLLSNAVKFSPKGGKVSISLKEVDSSVVIEVENTGKGIEPELLPHLFDRFTQGRAGLKSKMGLGLGLAIARGIVELHGGRIYAKNTLTGVRFTVQLPILAYHDPPVAEPLCDEGSVPEAFEPSLLRGSRLAVVEDEPEALDVLAHMLTGVGATVEAFASAEEFLARPGLTFDLLVSDLGLPGLGGLDLIRVVRSRGFGGPAIALTAYATRKHQTTSLKAGFSLHIAKPVEREELVIAVASLLGKFSDA